MTEADCREAVETGRAAVVAPDGRIAVVDVSAFTLTCERN
jgi:hypothetical protein